MILFSRVSSWKKEKRCVWGNNEETDEEEESDEEK